MGRGQNNKFFTGSGVFRQRDHYRIRALCHEFYKDLLVQAPLQRHTVKDRAAQRFNGFYSGCQLNENMLIDKHLPRKACKIETQPCEPPKTLRQQMQSMSVFHSQRAFFKGNIGWNITAFHHWCC